MAKPYWDETRQRWMIDDHGKPREATPEEIEPLAKHYYGRK